MHALEKSIAAAHDMRFCVLFGSARTGMSCVFEIEKSDHNLAHFPNITCETAALPAYINQYEFCLADIAKANINEAWSTQNSFKEKCSILVPTYLFGQFHSVDHIKSYSSKSTILLDAAQSWLEGHPEKYTFADYVVLSFGPGKILDAETGGAILLNDESRYKSLMASRNLLPSKEEKAKAQSLMMEALYHLHRNNPNPPSQDKNDILLKHKATVTTALDNEIISKVEKVWHQREQQIKKKKELKEKTLSLLSSLNGFILPDFLESDCIWKIPLLFKNPLTKDNTKKALQEAGIQTYSYFKPLHETFESKFTNHWPNSLVYSNNILVMDLPHEIENWHKIMKEQDEF